MVNNKINRAKQFMPFDALRGLQEALREKEIEYEKKKELTEESLTELQIEFNKLEIGSKVKIKCYNNNRYINILGSITNIDHITKKIQIDKSYNINVCDIIEINVQ